jgi:hypothetical protein
VFDYVKLRDTYEAIGYDGEVVEALVSVAVTLDKYDLTDSEREAVFNLLSESGRSKLADLPEDLIGGAWEPFNYGNVKIGDYVRVRPGSYDSETGKLHNGLVGKLVHMAYRRCLVDYLGEATGRQIRHPMEFLDSLKKR